ncbi:diguanylate cyclase [Aureimonas sp. Leaf454]|uniref:diguanylate cyclase domain-containing protein n=1 Tax=Aureimonas sp. Leaf454 TaxID=1736381 RepID=UPI000B1F23FC|nr:diguanylate cyclase [Aureimonas sp. Leaf454]
MVGQGAALRIAVLEAEIAAQAAIIRAQAAELAHSAKIFERAARVARIGVWECDLPSETLRWTDGVYDMFELPRGSRPSRQLTLRCYSEASAAELQTLRSRAIAERSGFEFDAAITTTSGRQRWIRVTATVECENGEPVRIFGMKQDITEEKLLSDRTRYLAEFDIVTGLANRTRFQSCLSAGMDEEAGLGALLIIDLDGFKQVNDTFGHVLGDECLRAAGRAIASVCAGAILVARIGGDEFAVLLRAGHEDDIADRIAGDIVAALRSPIEHESRRFQIGASVGIAAVDRSGRAVTPTELFQQADSALYAAKSAGRGTFRRFRQTDV